MQQLESAVDNKEIAGLSSSELFHDPGLVSISFRRHGAYDRDQGSVLRGQLTQDTMPATKESATDWVSMLPKVPMSK